MLFEIILTGSASIFALVSITRLQLKLGKVPDTDQPSTILAKLIATEILSSRFKPERVSASGYKADFPEKDFNISWKRDTSQLIPKKVFLALPVRRQQEMCDSVGHRAGFWKPREFLSIQDRLSQRFPEYVTGEYTGVTTSFGVAFSEEDKDILHAALKKGMGFDKERKEAQQLAEQQGKAVDAIAAWMGVSEDKVGSTGCGCDDCGCDGDDACINEMLH